MVTVGSDHPRLPTKGIEAADNFEEAEAGVGVELLAELVLLRLELWGPGEAKRRRGAARSGAHS